MARAPKWKKPHKNAVKFNGKALNINAFARRHGLDKGYLSLLLSGKRPVNRMSIEKAAIFAKAFGCTIEQLADYIRAGVGDHWQPPTETVTVTPDAQ